VVSQMCMPRLDELINSRFGERQTAGYPYCAVPLAQDDDDGMVVKKERRAYSPVGCSYFPP